MDMATLTAPKVTIDVYPTQSTDLRRRLREQSPTVAASLLPGGMILEEAPEALVYRMAMSGVWRVEMHGDDICLSNAQGAQVRVGDGVHAPQPGCGADLRVVLVLVGAADLVPEPPVGGDAVHVPTPALPAGAVNTIRALAGPRLGPALARPVIRRTSPGPCPGPDAWRAARVIVRTGPRPASEPGLRGPGSRRTPCVAPCGA